MNDSNSQACPLPNRQQDSLITELLGKPQTVAVVGMSPNPARPSHEVGLYLHERGFTVIPIHPAAKEIAGLSVCRDLDSVAQPVSVVALFVSGDRTGPIIEQAADIGARYIYFQPGTQNADSEARAEELGLEVFAGRCIMADYKRLIDSQSS